VTKCWRRQWTSELARSLGRKGGGVVEEEQEDDEGGGGGGEGGGGRERYMS